MRAMKALVVFCILFLALLTGMELRGSTAEEQLYLGLKFVVYNDSEHFPVPEPVIDEQDVLQDLKGINQVWGQCGMTFKIDEYLPVDEEQANLRFHPANQSEMNAIRRVYDNSESFLIVTTGAWNRNGSLGRTSANAWTNMPGEDIYGAILESRVGTFANLIAHELGHYLNLEHEDNQDDVMNPIISEESKHLTREQCGVARASVKEHWMRMVRKS